VTLDDRLTQLVRDALAPLMAEQFERLEERLAERLAPVVPVESETASSPLFGTREVAAFLAVSQRTIERMVASGEFPPPIRISPGRTRWRQVDVDAWLESRRAP